MNPLLAEVLNPAGYDGLPESLKDLYTPRQYAWLSDDQKAKLVERETEPEVD